MPPRIIPAVEKSRPPVYSPELRALLQSSYARTTKPLNPKSFITPPTMPHRADPTSEEARSLGQLSKRRQVNIHWRFFTQEWKKILPPLEVRVKTISDGQLIDSAANHLIFAAGIRPVGLQGSGIQDQTEAIAGPPYVPRPMTRRERAALIEKQHAGFPHPHSLQATRTLRRAYRRLLGRIPMLSYPPPPASDARKDARSGYDVSLSRSALSPALYANPTRLPDADPTDLAWVRLAECASESPR
jgi:hypothetical protein